MRIYDFTKEKDLLNNQAEIHFHKNAYLDFHGHTYWELIILIEGKTIHRIYDPDTKTTTRYVMEENEYCFLPPKYYHQFENIPKVSSLQITLSATTKFVYDTINLLDASILPAGFSDSVFYRGKLTNNQKNYFIDNTNKTLIAKKSNSKTKEILPKIAFVEFMNIFISNMLLPKNSYPEWFNELLEKINLVENLTLPISEICKLCGYSHRHLLRAFKTYLNMTINEYLTDVKLNYCCSLLASTNYTMLDICNRLNFSSLSHLNRIFREKYHMTPTQFRKQNKTFL